MSVPSDWKVNRIVLKMHELESGDMKLMQEGMIIIYACLYLTQLIMIAECSDQMDETIDSSYGCGAAN